MTVPAGALPVYCVGTADEAKSLLVLTCPTNAKGQYGALELVAEQTLENLERFAERLHRGHAFLAKAGRCHCRAPKPG